MDNQITHLTKVEIKGLWGKQDIIWDLNPDVNVLAGGNGSGKTTILECICELILTGKIPKYHLKKIQQIKLFFNNKETENYNALHFQDRATLLQMQYDIKINSSLISTFDTKLKPLELLKKVDNDTKTELDFELWQLQKKYLNYQVDLGKKLRVNKGKPDDNSTYFHDKFLEIIDNLFLETHKKVNRDKNELEFLVDDKEINAYQLSSGEKQFLVILLTVLVQDNKPSILFMDEPEISLHIEWQRSLIKYIRELNPNAQIIIATHSPDIIVHGWLDNVFNLQDLIVKDNTQR